MTCESGFPAGVVAQFLTFCGWQPIEGHVPSSSLAELSGLLWREREILDQLLDLLGAEDPGEDADADLDVRTDGLLHSISSLELHRAITAREAALELGLDGEPSLQDLIERSDDEWAAVLAGHRRSLQALSEEVRLRLRRVPSSAVDGNVVTLITAGKRRSLQRSLGEFLR